MRSDSKPVYWKVANTLLPGKASKRSVINESYPKPTQVGQVENTKALERTLLKELGKMVP